MARQTESGDRVGLLSSMLLQLATCILIAICLLLELFYYSYFSCCCLLSLIRVIIQMSRENKGRRRLKTFADIDSTVVIIVEACCFFVLVLSIFFWGAFTYWAQCQGIDVQFSWLKPLLWGILKSEVVGSNPANKLKTYKFMNLLQVAILQRLVSYHVGQVLYIMSTGAAR